MAEQLLEKAYLSLPAPRQANAFSTEVFLHSLQRPIRIDNAEVADVIEKLCKKAEVPKRLALEYSTDLKKTLDATPVAPEYAACFTILLLVLASENSDLKYLNCALKLVDGGLQAPVFSLPETVHDYADRVVNQLLATAR